MLCVFPNNSVPCVCVCVFLSHFPTRDVDSALLPLPPTFFFPLLNGLGQAGETTLVPDKDRWVGKGWKNSQSDSVVEQTCQGGGWEETHPSPNGSEGAGEQWAAWEK